MYAVGIAFVGLSVGEDLPRESFATCLFVSKIYLSCMLVNFAAEYQLEQKRIEGSTNVDCKRLALIKAFRTRLEPFQKDECNNVKEQFEATLGDNGAERERPAVLVVSASSLCLNPQEPKVFNNGLLILGKWDLLHFTTCSGRKRWRIRLKNERPIKTMKANRGIRVTCASDV